MTAAWISTQLSLEAPGFWLVLSALTLPFVYLIGRRVPACSALVGCGSVGFDSLCRAVGGRAFTQLSGSLKINWATTLSLGVAIFVGVLLVAAMVRLAGQFSGEGPFRPDSAAGDGAPQSTQWAMLTLTVLWIGAEQFHWSFVRGAVWELLFTLPESDGALPAYRAMWLATLLTLPEIWLQPTNFPRHLLKSALLIVTAVAFFYTRNFWLCWAIHAGAWIVIAGLAPVSLATKGAGQERTAP